MLARMQLVRFGNSPVLHAVESRQTYASGLTLVVNIPKRGSKLVFSRGEATGQHPKLEGVSVSRIATPQDLRQAERLERLAEDLKWDLRARCRELALPAKVVELDFSLDESFLNVSYSARQRLDLKPLTEIVRLYSRARINFSSIGERDEAVLLGALGRCGGENCSRLFLQELPNVSLKMSRDQGLMVSVEKITGPCGRLMCCLQHEHAAYATLKVERKRRKNCDGGCSATTATLSAP